VQDPDGVDWEVYVLNHDLDEPKPSLALVKGSACCRS
jgi:hypothetical protein